MRKKIVNVCIALMLCVLMLPGSIVNAAGEINSENSNVELEQVLNDYFERFYSALLMDSTENFSKDEFSSINGYIIAQNVISTRETYKKLLGGICSVHLDEVVVDDLTEKNDVLEAMVYVKYTYAYDDASEENQCTTGDLMKVTVSNNNEYIVQDIDSTSVEVQMVKDSINNTMTVNAGNSYDCYDAVDNYFEEIQSNADSLTEDIAYAEPIAEPEDDVLPLSTSVSYNAQTARV